MSYALPEFLAHAIAMEQEAADRSRAQTPRPSVTFADDPETLEPV